MAKTAMYTLIPCSAVKTVADVRGGGSTEPDHPPTRLRGTGMRKELANGACMQADQTVIAMRFRYRVTYRTCATSRCFATSVDQSPTRLLKVTGHINIAVIPRLHTLNFKFFNLPSRTAITITRRLIKIIITFNKIIRNINVRM